jgi:acetyl-CoA/propionyl-CoA carboxylase biotin carboxyl carrier protein
MLVPHGPGVRRDAGIVEGDTVAGAFDSMIAKLVVTGATRQQALERARRALAELVIEGMPTVVPFHRAGVADPAFAPEDASAPFTVHTRWIETEFDNTIEPWAGAPAEVAEPGERQRVVVDVGGKRREVVLPAGLGAGPSRSAGARSPRRTGGKKTGAAASGDSLTSPMQGTIVKVVAEDGQQVAAGDPVVVLEAMKMEQPLNAHKAGTITGLTAAVGETVTSGAVICEIKD